MITKRTFYRQQFVYLEGNPAKYVFIVFKGEFQLQKRLPK